MFVYLWARREPAVCSLTGCHLRDCAFWPAHCRWGLEKRVMKEVMVIARYKGKAQMCGSQRCFPLIDMLMHCASWSDWPALSAGEIGRLLYQSEGASRYQGRMCWKMQPEVKFTSTQILLRIEIPASKTWVPFCTSSDD